MRKFLLRNAEWVFMLVAAIACVASYLSTREAKPVTCENIGCIGCDCPRGFCKCVPGGKSCPACKHLRSDAEEHALKQQKLLEQAKRAKIAR